MEKFALREICGTELTTVVCCWAVRDNGRHAIFLNINYLSYDRRIRNDKVGGSIPPGSTKYYTPTTHFRRSRHKLAPSANSAEQRCHEILPAGTTLLRSAQTLLSIELVKKKLSADSLRKI